MNYAEIEQLVDGLSEEDAQELLNTEFPEGMEKQAEAELAAGDLANSLYALGALYADRAICSELDLEKTAAEELDQAEAEISESIEVSLEATGIEQLTDTVAFHKEASDAAALILRGYTDFFVKTAAEPAAAAAAEGFFKRNYGKAKDLAGKGAGHVKKHMGEHYGKYLAGAGGAAAGVGGKYMYDKRKKKK